MDLAQETDERLMQRVSAGERPALSILLRRYANPLLTFLRRMSGHHHRSEELFQEVFVTVWSSSRSYQYPRPFRAWLFGIAANKCHSERRRRYVATVPFDEEKSTVLAGRELGPVEGAILVKTATLIEQAVMCLPVQQRKIVVMRVWNEFSYAEIARILERDESTVRSNMFHALASLRRILEPRLRSSC